MAFSFREFDNRQDQDLESALARRQVDEQGKLRILAALQEAEQARANEGIRRDNAETNRVYREGIIEQRKFDNETEAERRRLEGEKLTEEMTTKRGQREALIKLANDPSVAPE